MIRPDDLARVYQHCVECGRSYVTELDLVQAYNDDIPSDCPPATRGSKILFCPECLHDFAFSPSARPVPDTVRIMTADRYHYDDVAAYNAEHPTAAIPEDHTQRAGLRRFTVASAGLEDDLLGRGGSWTVDFLPGGAPREDEEDRLGTVVGSRWGSGPIVVFASEVSLRSAWTAIVTAWPTSLTQAKAALDTLDQRSTQDSSVR
ncbi:hypothetical protein [Amycolatopsis sp. NPDC058986]|uniref:hypothetical protein n=1 Tax=unclassified Amycolatopsis TaxID=2618356 RepID=UPI00366E8C71